MVDEALKQQVMLMFRARDFESMWFICKTTYENLGFEDASDQQKIDEFKWIVQQLRKYMFSKQDAIIGCKDIDTMISAVDGLIADAAEYGDERKVIAYNFMRDHWLFELRNYLVQLWQESMMPEVPEEDEEE
jgi:hypothetical protein